MTTTTMHFGPEWMRPKHARPQNPPSPPPVTSHASPGASSYSSLVTTTLNMPQEKSDTAHPFRYSKDELLKIYKEGGGRGGLGLEVERWEGVVREVGSEPIAMKEWTDAERKLFVGSLNSEVRRRQSTDYLSPLATPSGERTKLLHTPSGVASPIRERFGNLIARRKDSSGSEQPALGVPRKLSLSSMQGGTNSPRDSSLSSPRTRIPTTPGFDGILNAPDSWTSRRRASEAGAKSATGNEYINDKEIKEEEEPQGGGWGHAAQNGDLNVHNHQAADDRMHSATVDVPDGLPSEARVIDRDIANHSLGDQGFAGQAPTTPSSSHTNPDTANAGPPPGIADVASVEWSYLDPQGQKWYDEGYFAADLLMKRTNIDQDWTPVGELAHRANGAQVFLSHFSSNSAPPGLARQVDSSFDGFAQSQDASGLNPPYQPIPTRSLHPSALEPYLTSGSVASDSPSSSFGAGRFGNGSPDPAAFGGHAGGHLYSTNDSPAGSRHSTFAVDPSSAYGVARRPMFNDGSQYDPSFANRSIGNVTPIRTSSIDNFGHGAPSLPVQNAWPSTGSVHPGLNGTRAGSTDPFAQSLAQGVDPTYVSQPSMVRNFNNVRGIQDNMSMGYTSAPAMNHRDLSRLGVRDPYASEEKLDLRGGIGLDGYANGVSSSPFGSQTLAQPFNQSPALQYSIAPTQPLPSPVTTQPSPHVIAPNRIMTPHQPSQTQSPWNTLEESVPKQSAVNSSVFPTSANTVSTRVAPPPPSPWARASQVSQPVTVAIDQSPWINTSIGAYDNRTPASGPSSLTVSNLGQHNQQQDQEASGGTHEAQLTVESPVELSEVVGTPSSHVPSPELSQQQQPRPHRKSSTQGATVAPTAKSSTKPPSPVLPTTGKPVWSTEDEKKKGLSTSLSLREIQEAEAKKQEVKKAAEREKERIARAAAAQAPSQPLDDAQTFTASWGLPTSQVGATRHTSTKEAAPSAAATPSAPGAPAPVWTNAVKPSTSKKTMKEIQEEEERRKKMAAKETAAAAAARRAYAETTTKSATSTPAVGGAWTTVGSNGKLSALTIPAGVRPVNPTATSTAAVTTSSTRAPNGTVSVSRSPAPAAVKVASASKVDDTPVVPSPAFMKWLNDSLKGLNNSVNCEEIMSMLLSFPLDVDPSTMEIISELIYANSTTLDGRRFAQEFVSKRKTDAASRRGMTTPGKGPSIADVVKAQPKPSQQSEWGGFKVVNKKKKSGRA
ncbi:hypothetical protein HETIRDRAFT_431920 [Heterobasidion irregulare TC 32-1]|uniref:GYF domain-containing protein n=1 Tax=Heterobasidion irregulare (strain TC 32-1) TaxID=747525 RepID=W4KP60_HETIT|nr:uncharacterized protein HETIRDRAFT_431920 [Heterobasidion irregulare TC 32-1]ETW87633.1 hypothetical protein HETIRDRAFT_431920 [Heterobasidion irregulare TC 32-1]